jgi:hypothetical protein
MIDRETTKHIKEAFAAAIKYLRKEKVLSEDFVGKFQVNCNSGGVTSVETNIVSK